ncbi:MAG: hypothetical protein LBF86_07905 [Helicobacteraceae bacterium]|jgi:hypothetical protein|nr:hypothetical protein [Helicobacteraceae bacterium]
MRFDNFDEFEPPKGVDQFVLPVIIAMLAGFAIFAPKIYIANEIYAVSLKLERNKAALEALSDGNSRLRRQIESKIIALENPYAQ